MRQGFHSPNFIVPKKGGHQPILDWRVLNQALHKLPFKMLTHYQMHPALGLVCSDRPEGRLHSCFDPYRTQTAPTVCIRGSGMAVQGPPPRALPVSPCLYDVQAQGGWGAGPADYAALAHPDLVSRTHYPRNSTSMAHSSEEGPPLSGTRHHMAPAFRSVEPPCVAPGRDVADLSGLPQQVVETIPQARAPSTRQTYALKWSLFANWCSSRWEDPRRCTIGVVLSFLQERLERRLSPSTLKVYVASTML